MDIVIIKIILYIIKMNQSLFVFINIKYKKLFLFCKMLLSI